MAIGDRGALLLTASDAFDLLVALSSGKVGVKRGGDDRRVGRSRLMDDAEDSDARVVIDGRAPSKADWERAPNAEGDRAGLEELNAEAGRTEGCCLGFSGRERTGVGAGSGLVGDGSAGGSFSGSGLEDVILGGRGLRNDPNLGIVVKL